MIVLNVWRTRFYPNSLSPRAGKHCCSLRFFCNRYNDPRLQPHDRQAGPPTPAWQWFCVSNVIAVVVFVASVWYLLSFWMANMRNHSPAYAFGQPLFDLCLLLSTGSMLYLFAFFGVAFVHTDATSQRTEDAGSSTAPSRHSPPGAATGAAAASQSECAETLTLHADSAATPSSPWAESECVAQWPRAVASSACKSVTRRGRVSKMIVFFFVSLPVITPFRFVRFNPDFYPFYLTPCFIGFNPDVDTDVLIVGAGTAGAALACVLARDGKRVTLIDRSVGQSNKLHSLTGQSDWAVKINGCANNTGTSQHLLIPHLLHRYTKLIERAC